MEFNTPEMARVRHYVARLIDAGATGLADTLVSKALVATTDKSSSSVARQPSLSPMVSSSSPSRTTIPRSNSTSVPSPIATETSFKDIGSSHRPIELVNRELKPITWTMWIINIFALSFYISETGYHYFAGLDLTAFVHKYCFRIRAGKTKSNPNQRVCCGCRRSTLPFFYRIHNSYVTWNSEDRTLIGTAPTSDEFGFLKRTVLQQLILFLIPSFLIMIFTTIVFPDVYSLSPNRVSVPDKFDSNELVQVAFSFYGIAVPVILISLFLMLLLGPSLVGSRKGSLPTLMPNLLQASTPEYMISYAWNGGMPQLARSLGEILPNAWLDVRSLVGGQLVSKETYLGAANARVTILLLTPQYLRSRNCAGEFLAVVSERRHTGASRCHQTLVLIEEKLLQGSDGIQNADSTLQDYRRKLEQSGYSVIPTNPEINWRDITTILTELGCNVVHSVEDLLSHLQEHACRATTHEDMATCLHWWTRYGQALSSAGSFSSKSIGGNSSDLRVPWNILGSKAQHGKRREVPPLCDRWHRVFCRRRPYKNTGLFAWEEDSVTTGINGAWIPYDASEKPQPHADLTPQFILAVILAIAATLIIILCVIYFDGYVDNDANSDVQLAQIRQAFSDLGTGIVLGYVFAGGAYFGFFFYSTDIFTLSTILHSSVLFPYFALSEVQDIAEMDDTSSVHVSSPTKHNHPNNTNAMVIRNPMTTLSPNNANVMSSAKPSKSQRRKFTVQFCHDESEIHFAIENFNLFIARNVFGLDKDTDRDNGYPLVLSAAEVLTNPEHPRPLTVYVFFLDSKRSQDAWTHAMQQKNCRWQPNQVVLVTNQDGLNSGTDLLSAEGLLKKLLILKTDSSGNGGGNSMINEILQCFDRLDRGETFPVNATTIPSSQAAREALHELLPRLGFIQVPCASGYAYASPVSHDSLPISPRDTLQRTLSSSAAANAFANVPLLLPTLGPLLAYGPAEMTTKRRMVEALENITKAKEEKGKKKEGSAKDNPTTSISTRTEKVLAPLVPSLSMSSESEPGLFQSMSSLDHEFVMLTNNISPVTKSTTLPQFPISNVHLPSDLPVTIDTPSKTVTIVGDSTTTTVPNHTLSFTSPQRTNTGNHSPVATSSFGTGGIPFTKASIRIQDHMLIVYETKNDSGVDGGIRVEMPKDSPYRGLVPAVLEAVSSKFGSILLSSHMSFTENWSEYDDIDGGEDDNV